MMMVQPSPALPAEPTPQLLEDLLAERNGLQYEQKELQVLVEEARMLCQRAESLRSRPPTARGGPTEEDAEEQRLQADHDSLRRRALVCVSRPLSARLHICGSRPTSAVSKKPLSRPVSARAAGPEPAANYEYLLLSPTSTAPTVHVFTVLIDRSSGESLGMKIRSAETVLEVTQVKDAGLVAAWNAANPSAAVRRGDRILEVNGVCGSADDLFRECTKLVPLQLVVESSPCELLLSPTSQGMSPSPSA